MKNVGYADIHNSEVYIRIEAAKRKCRRQRSVRRNVAFFDTLAACSHGERRLEAGDMENIRAYGYIICAGIRWITWLVNPIICLRKNCGRCS